MTTASPATGSNDFVFDSWLSLRDSIIRPRNLSDLGGSEESRREFLRGAELLRLHGERAEPGKEVLPQQLLIADMMDGGFKHNAILVPRRSTKSTSLIAVGLGRAESREDYRVGILTLTTGKAGRSRFTKDVVPKLERLFPNHRKEGPVKILKSAGMERIEFRESGGWMQWLSTEDDMRGEAFDLVILDESGEPAPDKVVDVLGAALPTLDTRPGGQIAVTGTAGKYRTGNLLWDWLERGRLAHPEDLVGIVDYSAPTSLQADDLLTEGQPDWEKAKPILIDMHPGMAQPFAADNIKSNFKALPLENFMREYMSVFGMEGRSQGLLKMDDWVALGVDKLPVKPAYFALAIAAHPDQFSASIGVAWRDARGKAHVGLLDHRRGVKWLADAAYDLARKHNVPIVYNDHGVIRVEAEAIAQRKKPMVKLVPQGMKDVQTSAALIVKEIVESKALVHYNQPDLNEAARLVVKRKIGYAGGWGLGYTTPQDDITPLEAVSLALRYLDSNPVRRKSYVPVEARRAA